MILLNQARGNGVLSTCASYKGRQRSYRFCTDFGKVNLITKTDYYPFPCVEDYIDKISSAEFANKLDLLKRYWQVPLTPQAKEITTFVTPTGYFQYKVMLFGLKNAPTPFCE